MSKITKTLNNVYSVSSSLLTQLVDSVLKKLSGEVVIENIIISGGTIDSTPIGTNGPAAIYATTIQSGDSSGNGYDVIFYGDTIGEYFQWDSTLGIVNISGGLVVTQAVDLGNLRISENTISSTNTNGDIILDPNGTGIVSIPVNTDLTFGELQKNISGTSTSLDISSDDVINLDTPETVLSGNITVNGDSSLAGQVNTDDRIITLANATVADDNKDRGLEFKYNSDKLGFFGYDDTDGYFTYIPDATNTDDVISGDIGNAKFNIGSFENVVIDNSTIYNDGGDLHIDSPAGGVILDTNTTVNGDLTITGNVNFSGGVTTNLTVERLSIAGGGSDSPSNGSNITFVTITGSGVATGTMPAGATDGFLKNICMVSIASGCFYELTFPIGTLVDPVSGTTVAKKMIFDTSGQSVQLLWDNTALMYIISQGGAEIVAV
jgi:hypothetical protein